MQIYFHIIGGFASDSPYDQASNFMGPRFSCPYEELVCDTLASSQLWSWCSVCRVAETPSSLCHFIPVSGDRAPIFFLKDLFACFTERERESVCRG